MGVYRYAGAGREHRVQTERQAGRVEHLFDLSRHHLGHAHAAKLGIAAYTDPAALSVGLIGLGKTCRCGDDGVLPVAALLVTVTAQRRNGLAGHFTGFFENGFDRFSIDCFGQLGQLSPEL